MTAPTTVRALETPAALALADLASMYDELGTVLRCCERLMGTLSTAQPDDLFAEALWTTAVLSYARCFAAGPRGVGLTLEDVTATKLEGDLEGWHGILLRLRDHYADPAANPRERYSVGASQDDDGKPVGIAVTSVPQPLVDEVTVRQTGALAYALSRTVDERLAAQQERVFAALRTTSPDYLATLPLIEVG